jgi:hypothetical protein
MKDATSSGNQGYFAKSSAKGGQQLLGEIGSAQHPATLCAVGDGNLWKIGHGDK